MTDLKDTNTLIAGGGSGMGLALAARLVKAGGSVMLIGRTAETLEAGAAAIGHSAQVRTATCDITDEAQVAGLMADLGQLDHIVSTAADIRAAYRLLPELTVDAFQRVVSSKLIGPFLLAKHGAPLLPTTGSITFTSGIAAYRPGPRGAAVASVNGALASLAYALALELAPIRVNVVSPGWTESQIWQEVAGDDTPATLAAMAKRLPVGHVAVPDDIAGAFEYLLGNSFTTGTVLHVDGGHRLV